MSWVKDAIAAMKSGVEIDIRPQGGSMRGRIESGQRVTLAPVDPALVEIDDIVFIAWKGNYLLHLVIELSDSELLIGNNLGKINGWVARLAVLGRVVVVHQE